MTYTIVYIGATWCAPCKTTKPAVQDLAKKFQVSLTVKDYDTDLDTAEQESVTTLPMLRVYKDETMVAQFLENKVTGLTEWLHTNILITASDDF